MKSRVDELGEEVGVGFEVVVESRLVLPPVEFLDEERLEERRNRVGET